MIILHNQHDKSSREFIDKYGNSNIVYDYPKCLEYYDCISSFPTIVIDVPAYYQELEVEEFMNEETNEIEEEVIEEPGNREAYEELFAYYDDEFENIDDFYNKAIEFKIMVEERAINSPPK